MYIYINHYMLILKPGFPQTLKKTGNLEFYENGFKVGKRPGILSNLTKTWNFVLRDLEFYWYD